MEKSSCETDQQGGSLHDHDSVPTHVVDRVSQDRWQEAQRWELAQWSRRDHVLFRQLRPIKHRIAALFGRQREMTAVDDDWNYWWAAKFDNYATLPSEIESAIEVGCGPYTNIRLIRERIVIQSIMCSDPLARHYVRYSHGWLSDAYRNGLIEVNSQALEEIDLEQASYDLVVMVNVLDHVRDAAACMRNAISLVKPEGYFILGQELTNADDLRSVQYDPGHPIRIDKKWLDKFVATGFDTLFYALLPRMDGRNPHAHYGTYLFIGQKQISVAQDLPFC